MPVSPMEPLLPQLISLCHCPQLSFVPLVRIQTFPFIESGLHQYTWPLFHWTTILLQTMEMLPSYPGEEHQVCCHLSLLNALYAPQWLLYQWQTTPFCYQNMQCSVVTMVQPLWRAVPQHRSWWCLSCSWVLRSCDMRLDLYNCPLHVSKSPLQWLASQLLNAIPHNMSHLPNIWSSLFPISRSGERLKGTAWWDCWLLHWVGE